MVSVLFISCAKDKTTNQKQKKSFEMYELSDMSMVMEQMFVENERIKAKILAGEAIGEYSDFFNKIHSAKTTEPDQFDDFFKEQAVLFTQLQKEIYVQTDSLSQKIAFNKMVDACMQCHEVKCQGPMQRIEKLYIQ